MMSGGESDWVRTLSKAASALRFVANNWEWNTEPAKNELLKIAASLTEIEGVVMREDAVCVWTYDELYDLWGTECGESWCFDGSLESYRVRFCAGCGKLISVVEEKENAG